MASLNDVTRSRALRVLESAELNVGELCSVLQVPQSTASRHLKLLTDNGWVSSRREGTSRLYTLALGAMPDSRRQLWKLTRDAIAESPNAALDDQRLERVLFERQTQSREFFASSAGRWDKVRGELFGSEFELRFLPALMPAGSVVLDLGCGTGRLAEVLAPFTKKVIGVDASEAMIQSARRRLKRSPQAELHVGRLEQLPFSDNICDVALLVLVMHYLADPKAALSEAARILKPGGKLLVVDMQPHQQEQYKSQMGHQWLGFSRSQVHDFCAPLGLSLSHFIDLPPDPQAKGPPLFVASASKTILPSSARSGGRTSSNNKKKAKHVTTPV